jgi:hypothetical protein
MAPPQFADLGKNAKELFNRGYNYGNVKYSVKTHIKNNTDFNITGEHNKETQKSLGALEAKFKAPDQGLTLVERWNTDKILKSELTLEDRLLPGLKLTLDTSFAPTADCNNTKEGINIGSAYKFSKSFDVKLKLSVTAKRKSGALKIAYKQDKLLLNTDVDFDLVSVVVNNTLVLSHFGWLFGLQTSFDTVKLKLIRHNFALGYQAADFTIHTNVNEGSEFGGSIYQRVNSQLELGVSLGWSSVKNQTRLALASKYKLDKLATVQAKVDNMSQVGLSYTQQLRDGVKLTVSSLVDGKNINGVGHKLGFGLELEV